MATITIQKKLSAMTEQIATAEQLEGVFNNPETYRKVCQIREARKQGDLKTASSIKNSLEGLIFVVDDFAECEKPVKVKENGEEKEVMQHGKWRLQKSAHLNGLAVLDVDHLKEDPRQLFQKWTIEQLRELGVLLVFITSSNEGIKFVFMARKEWGNLIQNGTLLECRTPLHVRLATSSSMMPSVCSVMRTLSMMSSLVSSIVRATAMGPVWK